ncbi:MAG: plastocyanin/azurin family copper-binding protein [Marmoricola sp.]
MNTKIRVRKLLRTLGLPVLLSAAAVLLVGSPAAAHDEPHQVAIKQYMYMPMALTIEQGDTVTWTNDDTVEHDVTITAGPVSFHSPMLAQGKSWRYTFTTAGSYSYICSVHPDMKATVTVKAGATAARPTQSAVPAVPAAQKPGDARTNAATPGTKLPAGHPTHAGAKSHRATSVADDIPAATPVLDAPASSATLQPLILVVGAAVAVVLFCLLLMASRPMLIDDTVLLRAEPKHLEES